MSYVAGYRTRQLILCTLFSSGYFYDAMIIGTAHEKMATE
jgi:hypothetical protein